MADIEKALASQVRNVEARTGKSIADLTLIVKASGLTKHSEIIAELKSSLGLGHGDANMVARLAKEAGQPPENSVDPLDALYVGPKASLRPIHDMLLSRLDEFGVFETAPKQKYVSYRRNRQFLMVGPATNTRVEVGLNIKDLPTSPRLERLAPGQMCNYRVKLTDAAQVDAELLAWVKAAYEAAG